MNSKIEAISSAKLASGEVFAKPISSSSADGVGRALNGELSFGSVLSRTFDSAMNDLRTAEAEAFRGIEGTATTREVVDAVMQADRTLQTATAVRDKLSSAFFEIAKMQF